MQRTVVLLAALLLLTACSPSTTEPNDQATGTAAPNGTATGPLWLTAQLTDVRTGNNFTLQELEKPLLVESFAVWCPTCLQQQRELEQVDATHLSLNTDPNEAAQRVREHVAKHGFTWRFAVSPRHVTESLIEEFGVEVVNAPSSPVVLVCEDGYRLLEDGLKRAAELRNEVRARC